MEDWVYVWGRELSLYVLIGEYREVAGPISYKQEPSQVSLSACLCSLCRGGIPPTGCVCVCGGGGVYLGSIPVLWDRGTPHIAQPLPGGHTVYMTYPGRLREFK